jgi:hypothetical protein
MRHLGFLAALGAALIIAAPTSSAPSANVHHTINLAATGRLLVTVLRRKRATTLVPAAWQPNAPLTTKTVIGK